MIAPCRLLVYNTAKSVCSQVFIRNFQILLDKAALFVYNISGGCKPKQHYTA